MNILQGVSSPRPSASASIPVDGWTRARCCAVSSIIIRYSIRAPSPPSSDGARSVAISIPTSAGLTGTTVFTRTGCAAPWTWPDASGPSYERRRSLTQGDEGMGRISAIWQGSVRHRRFAPRAHAFSYSLFMLGLDLDELPGLEQGRWFAVERAGLLSFRREDYLRAAKGPSSRRSGTRWRPLGDAEPGGRVLLLATCAASGFISARSISTSAIGRGDPLPAG